MHYISSSTKIHVSDKYNGSLGVNDLKNDLCSEVFDLYIPESCEINWISMVLGSLLSVLFTGLLLSSIYCIHKWCCYNENGKWKKFWSSLTIYLISSAFIIIVPVLSTIFNVLSAQKLAKAEFNDKYQDVLIDSILSIYIVTASWLTFSYRFWKRTQVCSYCSKVEEIISNSSDCVGFIECLITKILFCFCILGPFLVFLYKFFVYIFNLLSIPLDVSSVVCLSSSNRQSVEL